MKIDRHIILFLSILALAASCNGKEEETDPGQTVPGVPSGISLHSATDNSLTLQWSAVQGASSYDWRLLDGATEIQSGSVQVRNVSITTGIFTKSVFTVNMFMLT